jgi:hypothetical protein
MVVLVSRNNDPRSLVMSDLIEYFTRHYSLVIDNDQGMYNAAWSAVREVTKASEVTVSQYRAMDEGTRRTAFASEIGDKLLELVREWCEAVTDEYHGTPGQMLISEVMIYDNAGSSDLAWALGADYLPENDDADDYFAEDDETDDEDNE